MPSGAVAHFAQADVKEGFVRTLEGVLAGQAGELGHHADEADAAHGGDEGIALGHVADQAANLAGVRADIAAQDARGSGRRFVKAEQGIDERGFAGSVGTEQADGRAR